MSPDDDDMDKLEAVFHEAGLAEAEGEPTAEELAWAKKEHAYFDAQLAELERSLTPTAKPLKAIPASLAAMARDALLAKLEELVTAGRLQVAHRNLRTLSDDDLRRLIQSADPELD